MDYKATPINRSIIVDYYTLHDMPAEANLDDRQLMLEVPAAQF